MTTAASVPLHARTVSIDLPGPLLRYAPASGVHAWLHRDHELVAWGTTARIDGGEGPGRVARLRAAWRDLVAEAQVHDEVARPGSGPVAFASATFDADSHGSVLLVPEVVLGRDADGTTWCTTIASSPVATAAREFAVQFDGPGERGDRVRYAGSSLPDTHWLQAVADAIARLDAEQLDKVVLARDHHVWSREPFDARDLAWRLHDRFPGCFTFVVDGLVGASPELLARRTGTRVDSVVLAGSAPRGGDADADAAAASALLASDKDQREHAYAADSVRTVLGELCTDLDDPGQPSLVVLDNIQHLGTAFTGTLRAPAPDVLEIAAALHPTAAVGGTPTAPAVQLIRELEQMDRGRYAGPVGWIGADGDGEVAIALRCAELAGARARLFAGAGIVRGSLPEAELEETRVKLRAMQAAFGEVS